MRPPSSPPKNRTHDQKHQKKKGSRSRQTKPNKLNLLSPLPDFRLHSVHHSVKYDRDQSRADKSSAGSNHTSIHKHHLSSHLNPTSADRLEARMKKKRRGVVKSVSKSKSDLHKVSPTLPSQRAYSSVSRKELFAILEKIPEARAIRDWNLAIQSKEKASKFVPDPIPPIPSRPVKPSMFFNPFKFKRGRRREPKKDTQRTKKKVKGRAQPLGLHDQQMCKYHPQIVYPLVYPGDEPVMALTIDPLPISPSTIISVSPSLVAVSIEKPEHVPDEEAELEKLVASSDAELDEVIKFGSLCSVMIPETLLSCGISTADVVADNPVYHIDLGTLQDDETVVAGSKIHRLNKIDTTLFYDDSP